MSLKLKLGDTAVTWLFNWIYFKFCVWSEHRQRASAQYKTLGQYLQPSSPGLFSRSLRPGGGRIPKIKVTISRLKWNFAWAIIAIKACLMQNLSLVAFPFFGDMTSRISLWRRERVIEFRCSPTRTRVLTLKNDFCPESFSSTQNWPPMSISAIFKQRKNFSFSKFFRRLNEKRAAATPLIDQFC